MALGARAEPEAQLYAARGMPQNGGHGTGATAGHRTGLGAMRSLGRDWGEGGCTAARGRPQDGGGAGWGLKVVG